MIGDDDGWEMIEDVRLVSSLPQWRSFRWGSSNRSECMVNKRPTSPRQNSRSALSLVPRTPHQPSSDLIACPRLPQTTMDSGFTQDEIVTFKTARLDERRVQRLGSAFNGVPQRDANQDEHMESRVKKLGFSFAYVPLNHRHEVWLHGGSQEQKAPRPRAEADPGLRQVEH